MTSPNTIIADMQAEIDALRKERDKLLSALEEACECIGFGGFSNARLICMSELGHLTARALLRFRRLIASVKSNSPC